MPSAKPDYARQLHPRLRMLEEVFSELLARSYDEETTLCLMKMEVVTQFPGLGDRDQEEITCIVLEQMQVDAPQASVVEEVTNVIPFPGQRAGWR